LPASFEMKFRTLFLVVLLIFSASGSRAQTGEGTLEDWNPGYLVTIDDDTLYGPLSLLYQTDLVQINDENRLKTYGANQIRMVFIRDKNNNSNERYIYPFPYHPYSDFKPQRFFEMLFSGIHLSLLCREILVTETVPQYDNFTFRTYFSTRTRLQREFYLMFPGKTVRLAGNSRKSIFMQLSDKKNEMKKFMTEKNLSPEIQEDLNKIVVEYNRLKSEKQ
jgi:hypothetical protein